jgi:hypothetical protein
MKEYLLEKGIHANKLGKGALVRNYEEMVRYCETGEIPIRYMQEESEILQI